MTEVRRLFLSKFRLPVFESIHRETSTFCSTMKASLSKEVVSDSSDESGSESAGSSSPKRQTSKKGTDNVKSQSKKKSGTAEKTGQSHRPSEPEPANETLSHKERRQDSTHGKEGTVK